MQVSIRRKYEKQEVPGDYFYMLYMLRIRFFSKNSGFHGIIFISHDSREKKDGTVFYRRTAE